MCIVFVLMFRVVLFSFNMFRFFPVISFSKPPCLTKRKHDTCENITCARVYIHTDDAGGKDAERVRRRDDEENVPFQNTPPSRDQAADPGRQGGSSAAATATPGGGGGGGGDGALKEWVCSICTFANAFSKRKCSMCMEGSRPAGMGRAKPLSPRPPGEANRDFELQAEEGGKRKVNQARE